MWLKILHIGLSVRKSTIHCILSTVLSDFPSCLPSSGHLTPSVLGYRWLCWSTMEVDHPLTWQIWQLYFYSEKRWDILNDCCFMCVPTTPGDINPHKPDFRFWWAWPQPTLGFNTVIKNCLYLYYNFNVCMWLENAVRILFQTRCN